MKNMRIFMLLVVIVVSLLFRLYQLDQIPGELYGDISIIYEYTDKVLNGKWPFLFVLSNGPLYGYSIAPIIALLGQQGYISYKLASVVISIVTIACTYLFTKRLTNSKIALISAYILATSSWFLIFSRLGNSQIIIPLLTSSMFYFFVKGVQTKSFLFFAISAIISCLGLYTMPQTFILSGILLFISLFYCSPKRIILLLEIIFLGSLPFLTILHQQPNLFFSSQGYIGGKLVSENSYTNILQKLLTNSVNSLLMLHIKGDVVFRSNPVGLPHLDIVSGLFFLVGLISLLWRRKKIFMLSLVVPLFFLQIPSVLVIQDVFATPSASRTIGIIPFVVVIIAYGIFQIYDRVKKYTFFAIFFLLIVLSGITVFNWHRYFYQYVPGLPNQNTPIGKRIAEYIDSQPKNTAVYILGCCWGEWGQPEPKGILYVLRQPRNITFLDDNVLLCKQLDNTNKRFLVILPPSDKQYNTPDCLKGIPVKNYKNVQGTTIFSLLIYRYTNESSHK